MSEIALRRWMPSDLELLVRGNSPEMTRHLGGPESDIEVVARHHRYLDFWATGTAARPFVVVDGAEAVGAIGHWDTEWRGEPVRETGWFVLPELQGRSIGSAAVVLIVEDARAHSGGRALLTAFPAVENVPSNALCRRSGFENRGAEIFPFRGVELSVNAWVLDLSASD